MITNAIRISFIFSLALICTATAQVHRATSFDHRIAPRAFQSSARMSASLPDTVRVLAIMVEFQKDADTRSSGDGKFGSIYLYDYGDGILDPLPHDRTHFQNHLKFLENYVRKAGAGKTVVVSEVLDSIVTVSKQIKDYTFQRGQSEKPTANLAVEAWTIADKQFTNVDFSKYQMFVIFHASRGRDVDLTTIQGVDPTPYDIPSLCFNLQTFRNYFDQTFDGIPVMNGAFHITNCAILPTTDSREITQIDGSKYLLQLTINGLLAASFGTYAGLPDLFNTGTGATGIGRFGLEDGESIFAYSGICPPEPSAWEKQFLGWTIPIEATVATKSYTMTAHRTDQLSTPEVLRVPINGNEYWLLENRQRDPGGDGQLVTMMSGGREIQQRFPKDTTEFSNGNTTALKGVVTDVEDLDWALPGGLVVGDAGAQVRVNGGILIWHIDENIISANSATNTVNKNVFLRGVDLEQAGGPQDIGRQVSSIYGTSTGTGSPIDFWFKGNISPLYHNSFGQKTTPDSRANNGAETHVTVDNFSMQGPVMSLDVTQGDNIIAPMAGFPIDLRVTGTTLQSQFVQTADLDGDGKHELLVAASYSGGEQVTDTGYVFAVHQDGSRIIQNGEAYPIVAVIPGINKWIGAPVVVDFDKDGTFEIALIGLIKQGSGSMYSLFIWKAHDVNGDGFYDLAQRYDIVSGSQPFVMNSKLCFEKIGLGQEMDTLVVLSQVVEKFPTIAKMRNSYAAWSTDNMYLVSNISSSGIVQTPLVNASKVFCRVPASGAGSGVLNCISSDINSDGSLEGITLLQDRLDVLQQNQGQSVPPPAITNPLQLSYGFIQLSSADVDGDGKNDILIANGDKLIVLNYALSAVDYYPCALGARYALAASFPGDAQDAVFVVGSDRLSQLGTKAKQATGFPIPLPGDASVTLLPLTGSGSTTMGVAVSGNDGRLALYNTFNTVDANSFKWRSIFRDELNSNLAPASTHARTIASDFFPQERCYNWPNPTYDKQTKIRYYVSTDAVISVKIYDLAGEKVDELHANAIGGTDNEIAWDVTNIQSGVYLAHVEANGKGGSAGKIIKVAIVK